MSRNSDHDRLNKRRINLPKSDKAKEMATPASMAGIEALHSKHSRRSFQGRRTVRQCREVLNKLNEQRNAELAQAEDAKVQAILAEFAWKEDREPQACI